MNNHKNILDKLHLLDFAFQPIINIQTREIYAVEALLRNVESLGYRSIHHFFDAMYQHGLLYVVDLTLRRKAIEKFSQLKEHTAIQLFYNLDNRLLDMKDYAPGNTDAILKEYAIDKNRLCFEISERHEITREGEAIQHILEHYRCEGFNLAIDDFGVGFAGFKLLYEFTPDVIKIDRFFLSGICEDMKKRLIVEHIIQLAKRLGVKIIAEGIESQSELDVCMAIGCEYVQGYLIQRPSCELETIKKSYPLLGNVA